KRTTPPPDQSAHEAVAPAKTDAPEQHAPFALVAVGASAGGLEAFTEVLQNLPPDTGAAFVFIQHLDPKHISILGELLSKQTAMPVVQVNDQMEVAPNHVYVIPPNSSMRIAGQKFLITERSERGPHMPIDEFFRSLADQEGSRAIA